MKNKNCSPCLETRYREFSSLFFGESEDGMIYFDASEYIRKSGVIKKHSVNEFDIGFFFWKKAISKEYSIDFDDLVIQDNNTKNILIEESLALIFLSYIHPDFGVYLLQSMDEMLRDGFAVSDSYLIYKARQKFENQDIMNLFKENEEQ